MRNVVAVALRRRRRVSLLQRSNVFLPFLGHAFDGNFDVTLEIYRNYVKNCDYRETLDLRVGNHDFESVEETVIIARTSSFSVRILSTLCFVIPWLFKLTISEVFTGTFDRSANACVCVEEVS